MTPLLLTCNLCVDRAMLSTPASCRSSASVFAKLQHQKAFVYIPSVAPCSWMHVRGHALHVPSLLTVLQNKLVYVSLLHIVASCVSDTDALLYSHSVQKLGQPRLAMKQRQLQSGLS